MPSLRDWLTRKQKETRRGRAELRLADRAALWNAKPENQQLPSWWEWANIRLFTRKKDWSPAQKKMMRKAARYHGVRGLVACLLLTLLGLGGYERSSAPSAFLAVACCAFLVTDGSLPQPMKRIATTGTVNSDEILFMANLIQRKQRTGHDRREVHFARSPTAPRFYPTFRGQESHQPPAS